MFSLPKFSTLWFVLCFGITASAAFAVEIQLPPNTIVLEAELGEMEDGVEIIDNKEASGGIATDHLRESKTFYEIDIPEAGDWYIWIRIWCPNGSQDSYWIGMDEADPVPAEDAIGEQAVRIYSDAGDSVNTNDQPFNLWFWDCNMSNADAHSYFKVKDPGKYTLWSKGRESGTLIDQLLLTLDPNFNPEEATKGEPIDIVQAVYPEHKLPVTWGKLKNL